MESKESIVKRVLSSVLGVKDDKIDTSFSSNTCKEWDSIKHMNIIVSLEEEFGVEFDDDQMLEMSNFEKICEIVNAL